MRQVGAAPQTTPMAQAGPVSELTPPPSPGRISAAHRARAAPWSLPGCTGIPLWTHPAACHLSPRGMGEASGVPRQLMALPAIRPPPRMGFAVGASYVVGSCCGSRSHRLAERVFGG